MALLPEHALIHLIETYGSGLVGVVTGFEAMGVPLPAESMLVATGVMLGFVLLVMVGEQAFEMQQAGWIRTTQIDSLAKIIPPWAGVWFSVFPTVQTLVAQALAAVLVIGSYFAARLQTAKLSEEEEMAFQKN